MDTLPVIPRLEDLPYYKSPAIQFTYTSSAPLVAGAYVWSDGPTPLVPDRPLMENSLYYFRSITFAANLEELDFTSSVTTDLTTGNPLYPKFQMYLKSRAKTILFREPILMVKYLQNFDYRYTWITQMKNDQLFASFNGSLTQGPALIGVTSIKLQAVISAQEIVDERFIAQFKKGYPYGE